MRRHPTLRSLALTCALLVLIAALPILGGCTADATEEQLDVAADFIIGIITLDSDLVQDAVPADVADERPEYFESNDGEEPDGFARAISDGVMTVTADNGETFTLEVTEGDEGGIGVVASFPGETSVLSLVETDEGWRVATVDGTDVAELLDIVMVDQDELDASIDEQICFSGQLSVETAAEVFLLDGDEAPTDVDSYVPAFFDEVPFCPSEDSQYSEANSEAGYLGGLSADGILEPCSVHGYYQGG
jgi:hypothetical protein